MNTIFDKGDHKPSLNPSSGDAPFHYAAGKVYSKGNNTLYLVKNEPVETIDDLILVKMPANIAVYDVETGTVRTGDSSYIRTVTANGSDATYFILGQTYRYPRWGFVYQSKN